MIVPSFTNRSDLHLRIVLGSNNQEGCSILILMAALVSDRLVALDNVLVPQGIGWEDIGRVVRVLCFVGDVQ